MARDLLILLFIFNAIHISISSTYWFLESLPLTTLGHGQVSHSVEKVCSSIPGMVPRQYKLCKNHPRVMVSMSDGAKLGLIECMSQFKYERWNCSAKQIQKGSPEGIKKAVRRATRETAFLFAISSAGVVHSITKSCSKGVLMECECDPRRKGQDQDRGGIFTWGGCSDHIRFGMKMARVFMDAKDRLIKDARALMNLHNNKAGRRAVWRKKAKKCKCHGVSGACSMRTCWQSMEDFRQIGYLVKEKYSNAKKVVYDPVGQRLETKIERKAPIKNSIIYFEESPNYCKYDEKIGHPGIAGRECNVTSTGEDSCDRLCCGRGYDTFEMDVENNCDCKFYWCCHVRCKMCRQHILIHKCKALVEDGLKTSILFTNI